MELKEIQDTFHDNVVHILAHELSSSVKRTLLAVRSLPLSTRLSSAQHSLNLSFPLGHNEAMYLLWAVQDRDDLPSSPYHFRK